MKGLSPKETKPSLLDIKPKKETLPKNESESIKTEPKEEMGEEVKLKQVLSVSDVEKGDLVEQLAAKNKLLLDMISELKKQIAEKVNEIAERDEQIFKQDEQIAERDEQIVKHQLMYERILQGK